MATQIVQKFTVSDKNLLQPQFGVALTLNNKTSSDLTFDRCFTWSDTPTNPGFLDSIAADGSVQIDYLRGVGDRSIAAIVYTGPNESAYVLAWDAPVDNTPTPNRIPNYSKPFIV
ncbi:hypothetical protein RND81_02G197500 [Saponaria officinalis]|uniref:Uncharacterized protein n=1 Tax=Saponaria officinalis TaxID=3572 RepID=A0AAW1MN95_SAPOF